MHFTALTPCRFAMNRLSHFGISSVGGPDGSGRNSHSWPDSGRQSGPLHRSRQSANRARVQLPALSLVRTLVSITWSLGPPAVLILPARALKIAIRTICCFIGPRKRRPQESWPASGEGAVLDLSGQTQQMMRPPGIGPWSP